MSTQPSFLQKLMAAYMQGQQARQYREEQERAREEHALRIEGLKQQLNSAKLEQKRADFDMQWGASKNAFLMRDGQPAPMVPPGMEAFSETPGLQMPQPTPGQHEPVAFPDASGFGGPPAFSLQPQTMEQRLMMALQQKQEEAAIQAEKERAGRQREVPEWLSAMMPGVPPGVVDSDALSAATTVFTQQGQNARDEANRLSREKEGALDRGASATNARLGREAAIEAAKVRAEGDGKALSGEAAGRLAISTSVQQLADGLKADLSSMGRAAILRANAGLDTDLNRRIDDLIDASARVRTGANAPREEMAAKRAQILRWMDVATGDMTPAIDAIQRMQDEAAQAVAAIDPKGRHGRPNASTASPKPTAGPAPGTVIPAPDGSRWRVVGGRMVKIG